MLWLAAAVPSVWFWVLALLLGLVAGVGAYYGQQSVRQGLLLLRVVGPGQLRQHLGQGVAVAGRAEPQRESSDPMQAGALWIRTTQQEYRRNYSSSSNGRRYRWHTISKDEVSYPFVLHVGGDAIQVHNQATEVHGATRRLNYHDGGGVGGLLSGLFSGHGRRRTIVETLYAGEITVVGELSCNAGDGSLSLRKDDALGMLLTGYAGATQAAIELIKGVVGVLLPVAWLVGVVHYWPH